MYGNCKEFIRDEKVNFFYGKGCKEYAERFGDKVCDDFCNLCACSTEQPGGGYIGYHCNGHGECKANCTRDICHSARCECEDGWTGEKCEIPRNIIVFFL